MQVLIIHLLKASIYLLIFYLTWYFFFRRETFYRYNRIFLLTAFISSILLPFLRLPFTPLFSDLFSHPEPATTKNVLMAAGLSNERIEPSKALTTETGPWWNNIPDNYLSFLLFIYSIIAGFLLLKLALQLLRISLVIRWGPVQKEGCYRFLYNKRFAMPFSFFRFIFLHPAAYDKQALQHILLHEKAHASQRHTWDTLLASCYCCLCWFNPFSWLMKKALLLNLEYLADEAVLQQQVRGQEYQYSLLKIGISHGNMPLVNSFGQSFIKNRIVMMNKQPSGYHRKWKYLLCLPIALLSIGSLAARQSYATSESKYLLEQNGMIYGIITPKMADKDLQQMIDYFAARRIKFEIKEMKRNTAGLISEINMQLELTGSGHATATEKALPGTAGINPIFFYTDAIGQRGIGSDGKSTRPEFPEPLLNLAGQERVTSSAIQQQAIPGNNKTRVVKPQSAVLPGGAVKDIKYWNRFQINGAWKIKLEDC